MERDPENPSITSNDPVLPKGYSIDTSSSSDEKRPELFTKLKPKIIKSVSLYLQLIWDDSSNGKTIKVYDLISNSKTLFGVKYESKDIYVIRHIASDLREITLFSSNISNSVKKYYKNIDINRSDVSIRLNLVKEIETFLSKIVHLNYQASHDTAKNIAKLIKDLDKEEITIPDEFDTYFYMKNFEIIFENFCIAYIFNFYKIFSEFLYDDKE
jgi:hypothetical protein